MVKMHSKINAVHVQSHQLSVTVQTVMLEWEKLSTLFHVFLLEAKLANLSKYDSAANLLQLSSILQTPCKQAKASVHTHGL